MPGKKSDPGRSGEDNRRFVEAVLWVKTHNRRWSHLPEHFGEYKSVHKRYKRWGEKGIWTFVFSQLQKDIDTGLPLYALSHELGKITDGGRCSPLNLDATLDGQVRKVR